MSYQYHVEDEGESTETRFAFDLELANIIPDSLVADFEQTMRDNLEEQISIQFAKKGVTVTCIEIEEIKVWYTKEYCRKWIAAAPCYRLHYRYKVKVMSDKPFLESPMPIWVMKIIQWILQGLVIVFCVLIVAPLVIDWFKSLTSKKTVIRRIDPDTGEVIEEETTEPTLFASIPLIFMGIALLLFVFLLFGGRKR